MFDIDEEQVTSNTLSMLEFFRLWPNDDGTGIELWSRSLGLSITSPSIENLSVAIPAQADTQEIINLVGMAVCDKIHRSIIMPMFVAHAALLNEMVHCLQECSGKSKEEILNELEAVFIG